MENRDYVRIATAIDYISTNFKEQPSLTELSELAGLNPFYFQRLFKDWAGVSPKKFIQYLSVEYAKEILKDNQASLLDTAYETGLSGTGRLHDLFVTIEGMTPGEFRNGGENLAINYNFSDSPFGKLIVASTSKGVCHMFFDDNEQQALLSLKSRFPNAQYSQVSDKFQRDALFIFKNDWGQLEQIKLHLKGTSFQLKTWEALLRISVGDLVTYGSIAQRINQPGAARAVGSAAGRNPVAFLIPCHRVIQASGNAGEYMWGRTRKIAMIAWEAPKRSK